MVVAEKSSDEAGPKGATQSSPGSALGHIDRGMQRLGWTPHRSIISAAWEDIRELMSEAAEIGVPIGAHLGALIAKRKASRWPPLQLLRLRTAVLVPGAKTEHRSIPTFACAVAEYLLN